MRRLTIAVAVLSAGVAFSQGRDKSAFRGSPGEQERSAQTEQQQGRESPGESGMGAAFGTGGAAASAPSTPETSTPSAQPAPTPPAPAPHAEATPPPPPPAPRVEASPTTPAPMPQSASRAPESPPAPSSSATQGQALTQQQGQTGQMLTEQQRRPPISEVQGTPEMNPTPHPFTAVQGGTQTPRPQQAEQARPQRVARSEATLRPGAQCHRVVGVVQESSDERVTIQTRQRACKTTLTLAPNTVVMMEGQRTTAGELPEGAQVRASYQLTPEGKPVAVQIEARPQPKQKK